MEGGGHGFKMGWVTYTFPEVLNRVYTNCIAAFNRRYGFDSNDGNTYLAGQLHLDKNIAYMNGVNTSKHAVGFMFRNTSESYETEAENRMVERNVAYRNKNGDFDLNQGAGATFIHNSWDVTNITDNSFISLDSTGIGGPRQEDGSLPDITFLKLTEPAKTIMGW